MRTNHSDCAVLLAHLVTGNHLGRLAIGIQALIGGDIPRGFR